MPKSNRRIQHDVYGTKPRKPGINSYVKGANNERVCAQFFTDWTGQPFARVPRSGGLNWKNTARVQGDIICEDDTFDFPFVVETKHKIMSLSSNKDGKMREGTILINFWEQNQRDALVIKKIPILLVRKHKMKVTKNELGQKNGLYYVYLEEKHGKKLSQIFNIPRLNYFLYRDKLIEGFNSAEILKNVDYFKFTDYVTT